MQRSVEVITTYDKLAWLLGNLSSTKQFYSPNHSVLICGMGGQTRFFYHHLRTRNEVEVLWSGWSSTIWWTYLLSFLPGQAGLVKVNQRDKSVDLFEEIGGQSYCALFFVEEDSEKKVKEEVVFSHSGRKVHEKLLDESNYLLLYVDFDYRGDGAEEESLYVSLYYDTGLSGDLQTCLHPILNHS